MSTLDALAQIITNSVKDIQSKCAERGVSYPTLDVPPSPETDQLQAEFMDQAAPAIAAAYQLIATLQHSRPYLMGMVYGVTFSSGLAVAEAAFVPDILREAGPTGLHVNEIAAVRKVEPNKLAGTLRALASRHVFEEVSPDVFRNNRISVDFCTGKPVKDMLAGPNDRWDGTDGIAAYISLNGDTLIRSASWLVDTLLDPATAFSEEPNHSAFSRSRDTKLPCYDWHDLPGNEADLKRWGIAMAGPTSHSDTVMPTKGFDWAALPKGSIVVDVGGGVGNLTMALAKVHKHLRFIVQDRPRTVKEGEMHWKKMLPEYIESGAVRLQGHDFFEEQPVKDAAIFVMRHITHNWCDKYTRKCLIRLREAARPDTKLIIIDEIQDHLCRNIGDVSDIPGAAKVPAPEPLLPYPETAASFVYGMDMCMMSVLNSQERTLEQFTTLLTSAGWKLERIHRFESSLPPQLVCSPL